MFSGILSSYRKDINRCTIISLFRNQIFVYTINIFVSKMAFKNSKNYSDPWLILRWTFAHKISTIMSVDIIPFILQFAGLLYQIHIRYVHERGAVHPHLHQRAHRHEQLLSRWCLGGGQHFRQRPADGESECGGRESPHSVQCRLTSCEFTSVLFHSI